MIFLSTNPDDQCPNPCYSAAALEQMMNWNEEARISCRFSFKCPQQWHRLLPTPEAGVQYCPECDRDVYLALTEEEFRQHSEEGRCIAVPVLRPERPVDQDGSPAVVGRANPPYGWESKAGQ